MKTLKQWWKDCASAVINDKPIYPKLVFIDFVFWTSGLAFWLAFLRGVFAHD